MRIGQTLIRTGIAYEIAKDDGGATPTEGGSTLIDDSSALPPARDLIGIAGAHKAEALAILEGIDFEGTAKWRNPSKPIAGSEVDTGQIELAVVSRRC